MKITIDLPDLQEVVATAVETAMTDRQTELFGWKFFTLVETAELLQVKTSNLLDKRIPYLNEEAIQDCSILKINIGDRVAALVKLKLCKLADKLDITLIVFAENIFKNNDFFMIK